MKKNTRLKIQKYTVEANGEIKEKLSVQDEMKTRHNPDLQLSLYNTFPYVPFASPPNNLVLFTAIAPTLGTFPLSASKYQRQLCFTLCLQSTSRAQKKYQLLKIWFSVTLTTPLATILGSRKTSKLLRKLEFCSWRKGSYVNSLKYKLGVEGEQEIKATEMGKYQLGKNKKSKGNEENRLQFQALTSVIQLGRDFFLFSFFLAQAHKKNVEVMGNKRLWLFNFLQNLHHKDC